MFNMDSLIVFNKIFSNRIVDVCKDKKILLTLSGGMDTRAILSVLYKHNIRFDVLTANTSKKDLVIAKKLVKNNVLVGNHFIWSDMGACVEDTKRFNDFIENYDVVLHGLFMSGFFDKFKHVELSEKQLEDYISSGFIVMGNRTVLRKVYHKYF